MFGLQTGPSNPMLQKIGMGLNRTAMDYGDPNSQAIAGRTNQSFQAKQKKKNQLPVNGPGGMTPATSIMQTGNAAPNPYTMGGGGSTVRPPMMTPPIMPPMGGGMGMPPTSMPMGGGMPPTMPGQQPPFWNQYNQNRPPMMG